MSTPTIKLAHPIPTMLVLLLIAVCALTFLSQFLLSLLFRSPQSLGSQYFAISTFFQKLTSFPFSFTCIVWLTARGGRTAWATWIVPIVLLLVLNVVPALVWWVISFSQSNYSSVPWWLWSGWSYLQWSSWMQAYWIECVLLLLAFRATTLHLRPANAPPSPNRLTVFSILSVTVLVAFYFSADSLANLFIAGHGNGQSVPYESRLSMIARVFVFAMLSSLLWFSMAWLFVAKNPMRWLGGLGLVVYVALIGVLYFVIYPLLMKQQQYPAGVAVPNIGPIYLILFAAQVLHISFVFLCIGMMHLAGYRWDIQRRETETHSDTIPPLLAEGAT